MQKYKIVRFFQNSHRRITIHSNITLEQAQDHCSHVDSSSTTCTSKTGKARTRKLGPWFDGYYKD